MKTHMKFGIATAILMALMVISGIYKNLRKCHGACAFLAFCCFIGATITGENVAKKKE